MKKIALACLFGLSLLLSMTSCEKEEKFNDGDYTSQIQLLGDEITNFEAQVLNKQVKLAEGLETKEGLDNKAATLRESMLRDNIDNVYDLEMQFEKLTERLEEAEQRLYLNRADEIKVIIDGINQEDVEKLGLTDRFQSVVVRHETLVKHINERCYLDAIVVLDELEKEISELAELVPPTWPGDVTLDNIADFVAGGFGAIAGDLELDAFMRPDAPADFSDLEKLVYVAGDIIIWDYYEATDFAGFSNLKEVGGSVDIQWCTSITSAAGFENLVAIGGQLSLSAMPLLTDMSAFSNLTSVQDLSLFDIGIDALSSFGTITELESLSLGRLPALKSLDGLQNLMSVNNINIQTCDQLENVDALVNIQSVGGDVTLRANTALKNLTGLSGLSTIEGSFELAGSPNVNNLTGLENLVNVKERFNIGGNDPNDKMLSSLNGIGNLSAVGSLTLSNLNISNLDALSNLNNADYFTIGSNENLTSFCGLNSGFLSSVSFANIINNGYNPSLDDLLNGNCSN